MQQVVLKDGYKMVAFKTKEESLVFDDFVATKQQVIKKAEDETVLK